MADNGKARRAADNTLATRARDDWPASSIQTRSIDALVPYARNARTHDESQVAQIAASIREFGWTIPVLIDEDGGLIAGHGRILAARKLGITEIPTMTARGWTEAQKRAYVLLDNQLPQNAGWDMDLLRVEIGDLQSEGFNLDLIGFDTAFLDKVLAGSGTQGLTDPDEVPETPTDPVSRTGDVWIMGKHRLLCGDSTSTDAVDRLLDGVGPHLIVTDPPYCSGGFQEAGKKSGSIGTRGTEMIANDTLSTRGYQALLKTVLERFRTGCVYVFTDWRMWTSLFDVVESCGYGVRNMIVWDKGTPGMGRGWRMQHELVMAATRVKQPFDPKRAQGNVIQSKRTGNVLHPTEKPVDLLVTIIQVNDFAASVADPFTGSGSTLIACEMTGREFFGCEMAPAFVDVSVTRWERFTGQAATLDGDGRTFAEVLAERAAPGAVKAQVAPLMRWAGAGEAVEP